MRLWTGAEAKEIEISKLGKEPVASIDVLATRYCILDGSLESPIHSGDDLIQQIYSLLKGRGVWYLEEMLPLECTAHWVYQYFPSLWQLAKENTWDVQALYVKFLVQGFKSQPQEARV